MKISFNFLQKLKTYLCQKICLKSKIGAGHPTSHPYLSADTYRSLADCVIENLSDLERFKADWKKIKTNNPVFYISGSFIERNTVEFENVLSGVKLISGRCILHDCDRQISNRTMEKIASSFSRIYSINSPNRNNITNIPLGLENAKMERNGVLEVYKNYTTKKFYGEVIKSNLVFSAFNVNTNPSVRGHLVDLIRKNGYNFWGSSLSSKEYIQILGESYFTLSPVGNGLDCHRTWEALCVDCIPVVTKNTLSIDLTDNLPIFVVDTWAEFFNYTTKELNDMYHELISRKKDRLYAQYWEHRIRNDP